MRYALLVALLLLCPQAGLAQGQPVNSFTGPGTSGGLRQVKDLVRPAGMNWHSLTGYGLVVGLPGTGDSSVALSSPMMTNMLHRMGFDPTPGTMNNFKSRDAAVVAVTAKLPPVARSGDTVDVRVASLGDATSLNGGTLLLSLLRGPDGKIYATGQGQVVSPSRGRRGPVTGRVTAGGTVSRNITSPALSRSHLMLELLRPDYETAQKLAMVISQGLGLPATALSDSTVAVDLSESGMDPVQAMATIGRLRISPDHRALIVVDRSTGTVVAGDPVRLGPALISHKGMTVQIGPQGSTLKAVLDSLTRAGATPKDVVAVLEALHRVGSLDGDIEYR